MNRLAELQGLHVELARRIAELERLATASLPDLGLVTEARLKLTRASRRRTEYIERMCPDIIGACGELGGLDAFRRHAAERRAVSSDHISRWRPSEIERDWPGYQKASEAMRSSMRAQIRQEQELLYPMFRRMAQTN